jgi:hypothetical protein|tara:strand:+ start:446 stop:622 length:177 start_codon:yes stop_codon:yes gene_type:complete
MKVGDLVRVIKSEDKRYLNKLGVIINNGTWSADVYIIGSNSSWSPRIAKDKLEVIKCK